MASHVRKFFKDERLIQLMEFPVLFLGALPKHIPALYSLMNYADIKLGTWYPENGGMYRIVQAMTDLALSLGVEIKTSEPVQELVIEKNRVRRVLTEKGSYSVHGVIASADYHHVESALLPPPYRNYSEKYWQKRVLAPSSFIYYLGIEDKIPELHHHSLFFDAPFQPHAEAIYSRPSMPDEPLFYVSCPSQTDDSLAPAGHETLFILIPTAVDLNDSETVRQKYYHIVMDRLEARIGREIRSKVRFFKSYAHQDFKNDYHAFRGNAYGLANTLRQTAILKPSLFNKKVHNLLYAGQLTVPGPGVPPSIISGQISAQEMKHFLQNNRFS
jgi:phytoene desaturase